MIFIIIELNQIKLYMLFLNLEPGSNAFNI